MPALSGIGRDRPLLLAGPTASGKSALALALAERDERPVVNADALQVFSNWRILSARPGPSDEARATHLLYGHVGASQPYSVGHWLREVRAILQSHHAPIIVGGTGLYFSALLDGLAEIPSVPQEVRSEADSLLASRGLGAMIADLDSETASRIDLRNPARVRRAWEVLRSTGRGLFDWQRQTGQPTLRFDEVDTVVLDVDPTDLTDRIRRRFDGMIADGALDEVRANLPDWNPGRPSSKAIGARNLVAHLNGEVSLEAACEDAVVATRQYAKRQRTWFRSRMDSWRRMTV